MRQVECFNELHHKYEWVLSHASTRHGICIKSHITYICGACHIVWMSHVVSYPRVMSYYRNELSHVYRWFMSYVWMCHVTYIQVWCHTYEQVISRIYIRFLPCTLTTYIIESCVNESRHVYVNESCHIHPWVMSAIWMSHFTYTNASFYM